MRVAALADLHAREDADAGRLAALLSGAARDADVVLLGGDLTDHGRPGQAEAILEAVHAIDVPVVAVLGNHDHEGGCAADIARMLGSAGIHVLDKGGSVVLGGVGFAGTKGFAGGFGRNSVRAFGEDALKSFVSESVVEAQALRAALKGLGTPVKVALTHYSPILATVATEPEEIHSFLGTSRLAQALDEGGATVAFHGHAHHGTLEGRTEGGVPVYNVSLPVLHELGREHLTIEV
jgi:Icc-related predicted phosphoesterase